tara:strand:- start:44 stop:1024 length:981 start_codon:yes stop_codon:yes gene_type:complete
MPYITTIIENKYMSVGGFGHIFYDVLSSYIISHLFNLTYVYSPIISLGNEHHTGINFGSRNDDIVWDDFLKFNKDETTIEDILHLPLKKIEINLCKPFKSINITKLEKFIKSYDDNTLFILTNNNRVYLNELYYINSDIYVKVFHNLKTKLGHLKYPNKNDNKIKIAIHIRRGDWDWQPLSYNIEFIKLWKSLIIDKNIDYEINIYSLGKQKQLDEIKNKLDCLDNNIIYYFNTDVYSTFKDIYNADIVIGGHSSFSKIITLFSNNLFIYLPYNDGVIQALGVNNEFKLNYLGNYPELFDIENRIETDIYCKKNKELIIQKIQTFM